MIKVVGVCILNSSKTRDSKGRAVECSLGRPARVQVHLAWSLSTFGVSVTPAADRLAEFDSVEGAYLAVFLRTVRVSLLVATICTLVGYPAAYFIAHRAPRLVACANR